MNVESKDIQEAATRETRSESAPRQRSLGLATCTALVIGNMIGSGFFIAPSALAPYGTTAIIGWGVGLALEDEAKINDVEFLTRVFLP